MNKETFGNTEICNLGELISSEESILMKDGVILGDNIVFLQSDL